MPGLESRDPPETLADAVMAEITRVRDRVMPAYLEIGREGLPALAMMRATMDAAIRALAEGNASALLALHLDLRGFHT